MSPIKVIVDEDYVDKLVEAKVDRLIQKNLEGVQWGIDEFRKVCCGNRSREWVVLYIFREFEDEIVVKDNHGWLEPSEGRGSKYRIWALKAKRWIEVNHYRINWGQRLPW